MCAEANITEKQQAEQGQEVESTRARPVFLPCTDIFERGGCDCRHGGLWSGRWS